MACILRISGDGFQFSQKEQPLSRRTYTDADGKRFRDWARRYDGAAKANNDDELLKIGQEIFAWLDADGHGWGGKLLGGAGEIGLDIAASADPDEAERAFLKIPWETLARDGVFLAENALRPFCIQRRLGEVKAPASPKHQDLAAMFMAAATRNVEPVLDFEAEETGILKATDNLPLLLTVEESGCAAFLHDRLAAEGPFEIVHLTCHGNIADKDYPDHDLSKGDAYLALEDEEGNLAPTTAPALAAALGPDLPHLVFLNACRTAQQEKQSVPLALSLMRAGLPAVLGWDGSVYDVPPIIYMFVRDINVNSPFLHL